MVLVALLGGSGMDILRIGSREPYCFAEQGGEYSKEPVDR